jgi:hypothetical protein
MEAQYPEYCCYLNKTCLQQMAKATAIAIGTNATPSKNSTSTGAEIQ